MRILAVLAIFCAAFCLNGCASHRVPLAACPHTYGIHACCNYAEDGETDQSILKECSI